MAVMKAPESGVTVRMYRQGQGDCFLLAFPRRGGGRPVFVMIDCGYMSGSQITRGGKKITTKKVARDIAEATGKKLDLVVVTHEHADHVNGLKKFRDFDIKEAWFAWTEDGGDRLANELRRRHGDQLLGLVHARNQLASLNAAGAQQAKNRLDDLLTLEIGEPDDRAAPDPGLPADMIGFAAGGDPTRSHNKTAMKVIRDIAGNIKFLSPHKDVLSVPDVDDVKVFVLGPPRRESLLKDEDPRGDEAFPGHGFGDSSLSFFAAAKASEAGHVDAPFALSYGIAKNAAPMDPEYGKFFSKHYGHTNLAIDDDSDEADDAAPWRRIDEEWLFAAESFALKLNRGVNNTSLVLAFELADTGKVLLFAGDAQRGNWISWNDGSWSDGARSVTCRDLLERTVLYKLGHHGSHNATLDGKPEDDWPNLGWMARKSPFSNEFVAMIPANKKWANSKKGWEHPLPSIREAVEIKTQGRVFQIDMDMPEKPASTSASDWDLFTARSQVTDLYFEYHIPDEF